MALNSNTQDLRLDPKLNINLQKESDKSFLVKKCDFIDRKDFPDWLRLDGRESVGIVGVKKWIVECLVYDRNNWIFLFGSGVGFGIGAIWRVCPGPRSALGKNNKATSISAEWDSSLVKASAVMISCCKVIQRTAIPLKARFLLVALIPINLLRIIRWNIICFFKSNVPAKNLKYLSFSLSLFQFLYGFEKL